MRVLVVDDDTPSVDALRVCSKSAGHRVDCAGNGREALSRLREASGYCVILLDIMMPVMNGYEFREEQLKDPNLASIPVIVVTADGRAREKAQQIGSDVLLPETPRAAGAASRDRSVLPSRNRGLNLGLEKKGPRLPRAAGPVGMRPIVNASS